MSTQLYKHEFILKLKKQFSQIWHSTFNYLFSSEGGGWDRNCGEVHAGYQGNGGGECSIVIGWEVPRWSWTEASSLVQFAKSAESHEHQLE